MNALKVGHNVPYLSFRQLSDMYRCYPVQPPGEDPFEFADVSSRMFDVLVTHTSIKKDIAELLSYEPHVFRSFLLAFSKHADGGCYFCLFVNRHIEIHIRDQYAFPVDLLRLQIPRSPYQDTLVNMFRTLYNFSVNMTAPNIYNLVNPTFSFQLQRDNFHRHEWTIQVYKR